MPSTLRFLRSQFLFTPPYPEASFQGKTVLVTGANRGLGLEATRHFVRLGASKVIMAVRTISRGENAKMDILNSCPGSQTQIEIWPLDLMSYASIDSFAERYATLTRLDVVVCNAAVITEKFRLEESHETTILTNVISTFLLSLLALPKMKETAHKHSTNPRLTLVTSEAHLWTEMPERTAPSIFKRLDEEDGANMQDRYNVSKLLEILVVREIFDKVIKDPAEYPVIINMVNPGLCHSELADVLGLPIKILKAIFARKTEVGSRTLVDAALQGQESMGQYISDCKIEEPSPFVGTADGKETQRRVWEELSAILEEIHPGVTKMI